MPPLPSLSTPPEFGVVVPAVVGALSLAFVLPRVPPLFAPPPPGAVKLLATEAPLCCCGTPSLLWLPTSVHRSVVSSSASLLGEKEGSGGVGEVWVRMDGWIFFSALVLVYKAKWRVRFEAGWQVVWDVKRSLLS